MKKTLLVLGLIMVIAVGVGVWWYKTLSLPAPVSLPVATTSSALPSTTTTSATASPKNATYMIEGIPVTLVNGTSETPAAPGSAEVIETNYFGNEVTADFNHDGRSDTAFLLTQSTGGTGVFYYLVAALNLPDGYQGSEGFRIGDRIAPQSTTLQDGVILVQYADRKPNEPFSVAPSVGKTLRFTFDTATQTFSPLQSATVRSATTSSVATNLTGKTWQWVRTNYTDGRVFVPKQTNAFSLTFQTDGHILSTTDCNSVHGPYTTSGTGTLIFGRMAMTMMYCDGSEEGVFDDLLGQVATYSFTNKGELYLGLKAAAGTMIFQ